MSEHRRRKRRMQSHDWGEENAPSDTQDAAQMQAPAAPPRAYEPDETYAPEDWGEDPANQGEPSPEAPEDPEKAPRREMLIISVVVVVSLVAAVIFGVLIYLQNTRSDADSSAAPTAAPYDASQPFLPADITAEQLARIEEGGGSFALMDYETGPHGIQIGDSLDTLLARFPVTSTQSTQDGYAWDAEGDNMTYLTYDYLETDYQVIYAERVFYQEGEMIVLPPSATLSVNSDMILVTLTAPLTPYPEGTAENYLAYPHVYCKLTIDPDTSKITRIVLGQSE